ncbi:MAG: hypothetical protein ACI8TQ_001955 [Planctomycetota bacterium]|jgi:hypothetical protein
MKITKTKTFEAKDSLEDRIIRVSEELLMALIEVLESVPGGLGGPQELARSLNLDKVLTSRLLKATRTRDPMAMAYHLPGPEPVRRFLRAARRKSVDAALITRAESAVEAFHSFIREEVGDRSALDALISAWLPEAREEFESRRKQSAYRAMSQLRGTSADMTLGTVLLHPSQDGESIDVVWAVGLLGLRRVRLGARAKLTTRRLGPNASTRKPMTLSGESVESLKNLDALRLDEFCNKEPAPVEVRCVDDSVHYLLAADGVGTRFVSDFLMAEVNLSEMPHGVPAQSERKGYVFAEVSIPTKALVFDVLVHNDVFPGSNPELYIYDTALEGYADVNDRTRDLDRMELAESVNALGHGSMELRIPEFPKYVELLRHIYSEMRWDESEFRNYRCRIEYPIYGSQVALAFDPPKLS